MLFNFIYVPLFAVYYVEIFSLFSFKFTFPVLHARYDQLLKTSHAFNILDSRGFVGVTERARYFGRMRR
jgi:glycyl-tRNA synthetase alpha subunit